MPELTEITNPVILFDGVCNLCSGAVQFVLKRDKKNLFRFASLQSEFGQKVLQDYKLPTTDFNSFHLLTKEKIYSRSTAALMVAKELTGAWSMLYYFIIIPPFIRDAIYNIISKNRYKWFGRKAECWLPTAETTHKFF